MCYNAVYSEQLNTFTLGEFYPLSYSPIPVLLSRQSHSTPVLKKGNQGLARSSTWLVTLLASVKPGLKCSSFPYHWKPLLQKLREYLRTALGQ